MISDLCKAMRSSLPLQADKQHVLRCEGTQCVSAASLAELQGLLASTAPVFMHETSRQIVGSTRQLSLSDGASAGCEPQPFSSSTLLLPIMADPEKGLYGAP